MDSALSLATAYADCLVSADIALLLLEQDMSLTRSKLKTAGCLVGDNLQPDYGHMVGHGQWQGTAISPCGVSLSGLPLTFCRSPVFRPGRSSPVQHPYPSRSYVSLHKSLSQLPPSCSPCSLLSLFLHPDLT